MRPLNSGIVGVSAKRKKGFQTQPFSLNKNPGSFGYRGFFVV